MTHDVAEDVDIYSDLTSVNYSDNLNQLETSNRQLLKQVENLKLELSGALKEKQNLEKQCQVLSHNISSLFKTAQAEIERKNRTISELRSEINNVLFRRNNKMGGSWSSGKSSGNPESLSTEKNPRKEHNENVADPKLEKFDRSDLTRPQNETENTRRISRSRGEENRERQPDKSERKVNSASHKSTRNDHEPFNTSREESRGKNCLSRTSYNDKYSEKVSSSRRRLSSDGDNGKKTSLSGRESSRQYSRREDRDISKKRHHIVSHRVTYRTRSSSRQLDDLQISVNSKALLKDQLVSDKSRCSQSETLEKLSDCQPRASGRSMESQSNDNASLLNKAPNSNEICDEVSPENPLTSKCNFPCKEVSEIRTNSQTSLVESSGTVVLTEYSRRMLKKIQGACSPYVAKKGVTSNDSSSVNNNSSRSTPFICENKTEVSVTSLHSSHALNVPSIVVKESSPTVTGKEKVVTSQEIHVVESSKEVVVPDSFSVISSNLSITGFNGSLDLSISSSSTSDAADLNSSKIMNEVCSDDTYSKICSEKPRDQVDDHQSNGHKSETLSQSSKKDNVSELILCPEKPNGDEFINPKSSSGLPVALTVDLKPVRNQVDNAVTTGSEIKLKEVGEQIKSNEFNSNVCADSILCSNSIQDILNSSGGKHVNYELFSLESIDTFSLSPSKSFSKAPFHEPNAKLPLPPNSNKTVSDDATKTGVVSLEHPACNLICKNNRTSNLENEKRNNKISVNETTAHRDLAVENNCLDINGTTGKTGNHNKESIKDNKSTVLSTLCISENESVKVNNQVVESYTSKIVQVKKKNGIQPIIKPISSLWSKSIVKHDTISNGLSSKLPEEKISLDRLVKNDVLKSKSDLVHDIFGSPVKWADSDSTDFVPPTIEKDPSVFEDSCSVSEVIRIKSLLEDSTEHKLPESIKDKNSDNSDSNGKMIGGNDKNAHLIESKFKSNLISSCLKIQSARYEDSILGQFEDTLQFVSALSKPKKTVSPICTPEKFESEKPSEDSNKPFSTLTINQKAGFKIVGPYEKPINILVPRKTPRVVSPVKPILASTLPNSSESKHCRISCIDDKAIESVCNLVSSIKDTHRETYLVINKKNKSIKNSSPKKNDSHDNHLSKTKSPTSAKVSPKSFQKNGSFMNLNKSEKTSPGKKLKLSPKKKALMKLASAPNPPVKVLALSNEQAATLTESSSLNDLLPSQNKSGRAHLIDGIPLIPKTNNCTRVRMSYELKKPSRMSGKNVKGVASSPKNISNPEADIVFDKVEFDKDKTPEERTENTPSSAKNILNVSSKLDSMPNKLSEESEIDNVSEVANISNTSVSNSQNSNSKRNLSKKNVPSKEQEMPSKFNCVGVKDSSQSDIIENLKGRKCNKNSLKTGDSAANKSLSKVEIDIVVPSTSVSLEYKNSTSKCKGKAQEGTVKTFRSCSDDIKSEKHGFTKSKNRSPSSSNSLHKKSSGSESKKRTSKCQFDNVEKQRKSSSSGMNKICRRETPEREFPPRSKSDQYKPCSNAKGSKILKNSYEYDYHYDERYSRYRDLSYRQRLSKRYSSYLRREPSVCRSSRSRRNSRSSIYSRKSNSHRRRSRSTDANRSVVDKNSHTCLEPHNRQKLNLGPSRVEILSALQQFRAESPAKPSYDRINGISCNNIVWKLIPVFGVPDWPKRKIPPDNCNVFSPIQTPTVSPSPSRSIMSPIIVAKKRSFNFSSSDVKTESFSSSPNKSNSSSQQSSFESRVFKTPQESSCSKQKLPVSKESTVKITRKNKSSSKNVRTDSGKDKKPHLSQEVVILNKRSVKSKDNCKNINLREKLCKSDLSSFKELDTFTYRRPSFIKSSEEEMVTVNVKKIKDKFSEVFSASSDKVKEVKEYTTRIQDSDDGLYTDSSFSSSNSCTSDESWAPKKKRKRR